MTSERVSSTSDANTVLDYTDRAVARRRRSRIVGFVLALLSLAVIIYLIASYAGIRHLQASCLDNEVSVTVQHPDGNMESHPDSHRFASPKRGDTVHVTVNLPARDRIPNAALCFFNYNSVLKVSYHGRPLYEHGKEALQAGRASGHIVARVLIPNEAWGQDMTIDMLQLEDNSASNIHGIYAMSSTNAWLYPLLISSQPEFVASYTFCLASIVMLVVFTAFFWTGRSTRQGIYLALFCLCLSLWDMSYTSLVYLVTDDTTFTPIMEYLALHLIAVFFFGYLHYECRNRRQKFACSVLMGITGAIAVFALATEAMGIVGLGFLGMLNVTYVELAAMAIAMANVALSGGMRLDASRRALRLGTGITVALSIVEAMRVFLNRSGIALTLGISPIFIESTLAPVIIITFESSLYVSYIIRLVKTLRTRTERLQLERIAYTDALTGIPNRTSLDQNIEELRSSGAKRYSFLFFDVDRLKTVNDGLGHEAGDQMIQLVGRALAESCVGCEGFYGRYGGDEFVVCVYRKYEADQIVHDFEKILSSANKSGYLSLTVEVSVGRADHVPGSSLTVDEELRRADDRMYADKVRREGKDAR